MASKIISEIRKKAKKLNKTIILPEGNDKRVIQAAKFIEKNKLANIILVQDKTDYLEKGLNLLAIGEADGLVCGATTTTSELYKKTFKIIGAQNKFASTYFLMTKKNKTYLFADCALNVEPSPEQLAHIASQTVDSAEQLGLAPVVAFLSFSTKGSANHISLDRIKKATQIFKKKRSDVLCDGELQVDAALVHKIAKQKAPKSEVEGNANILIFPDLNSGNIAYKLVEQLGEFEAIGPISQGLNLPVNDLSRGCSVEDIVNVVCITAIQSEDK